MKCFICGHKCLTIYYSNTRVWQNGDKITHVGKQCPVEDCGWASWPTKVPDPIQR